MAYRKSDNNCHKFGKTRTFLLQVYYLEWMRCRINDKSLMSRKSTNDLLGWVVEKIGEIPGTVAPSFGSKRAGYC